MAAALVAAGGALYRYRPRPRARQGITSLPTLEFPPHWDVGSVRIEPTGGLTSGPGLQLVSGIELGAPRLDSEHLVKSVYPEEGRP